MSEAEDTYPVANVTRLRPDELEKGSRLAAMFPGRRFRESKHEGADLVDDLGTTYDVMGGGARASQHFNLDRFILAINWHLLKDTDLTVIDVTEYTEDQVAAIRLYVDSLPEASQAKIVRIGF